MRQLLQQLPPRKQHHPRRQPQQRPRQPRPMPRRFTKLTPRQRTPAARPMQLPQRRRIAFPVTPTLRRPLPAYRLGASSCPKPARVRSTRRPSWLHRFLSQAPATRRPAFNAANRSSIAVPPAALADTPSAPQEAHQAALRDNSPAVRAPSIPLALLRAVTQAPVGREHPEHAPALAHVPALGRLVRAGHRAPAALHPPAKLHARSVLLPEAVADARSIPRPRKVR
jgi:hypothetical protein